MKLYRKIPYPSYPFGAGACHAPLPAAVRARGMRPSPAGFAQAITIGRPVPFVEIQSDAPTFPFCNFVRASFMTPHLSN